MTDGLETEADLRSRHELILFASCRGLAGLSVLLLAGTVTAQADDWPQWRGPNRDGVWHESGTLAAFPPGGLEVAWRAPVGRGWSSPVVAQGRVYVTDVQATRPAARERVLCLDAATGRPLWSHQYAVSYPDWAFDPNAGGPRATPIIRDGRLYTLGALGHLFCLDAIHGEVLWKRDLARDYQVREFTGITASPLIEGDRLILYICGKPGACVVGLNKDSGKEQWRALDDSFTYSSPITIAAGGQRQLIVWTQEAVTSLDPASGRLWWREAVPTSGDQSVSTPVWLGQRLYVAGLMFRLERDRPAAAVVWIPRVVRLQAGRSESGSATARGYRRDWVPAGCGPRPDHDFTRLSVVGCSGISLPSMIALQLVVIVSASLKVIVKECMWDSFLGLIPQVLSKSNCIVLASDAFRSMAGRLPMTQ